MKVWFERSGGFTGIKKRKELDTEALPDAEREELERLIAAAGFFELADEYASGAGADRFQYRVTVDSGDQAHTVRASEEHLPPSLRSLVTWLSNH